MRWSKFTRQQWFTLILIGLVHFVSALCVSIQAPFYPREAEARNATATEYGFVFGIYELVAFMSSPILGNFIEKIGVKFLLNAGVFTAGSCCILFGFLDWVSDRVSFISLSFAIRIVEAMGSSAAVTSAFAITAVAFPDDVATMFATLEIFYGLGNIAGPSLGGLLYAAGGFILPFLVMGCVLLLVALAIFFFLPSYQNGAPPKSGGLTDILKVPAVLLDSASITGVSMCIGFYAATLEPHIRSFKLSPVLVGLVFITHGGTYALIAPIIGRLCDKHVDPRKFIILGCALTIASVFLVGPAPFLPFDPTLPLVVGGLILLGVAMACIMVSGFIDAIKSSVAYGFPDDISTYGLISGLWASAYSLGDFIGPSAAGLLDDMVGFRKGSMFIVGVQVFVLTGMSIFICRTRLRRNAFTRLPPSAPIQSSKEFSSSNIESNGEKTILLKKSVTIYKSNYGATSNKETQTMSEYDFDPEAAYSTAYNKETQSVRQYKGTVQQPPRQSGVTSQVVVTKFVDESVPYEYSRTLKQQARGTDESRAMSGQGIRVVRQISSELESGHRSSTNAELHSLQQLSVASDQKVRETRQLKDVLESVFQTDESVGQYEVIEDARAHEDSRQLKQDVRTTEVRDESIRIMRQSSKEYESMRDATRDVEHRSAQQSFIESEIGHRNIVDQGQSEFSKTVFHTRTVGPTLEQSNVTIVRKDGGALQNVRRVEYEDDTVVNRGVKIIRMSSDEFESLQTAARNAEVRFIDSEISNQRVVGQEVRGIRQHGDFSETTVQTGHRAEQSLRQPEVVEVTTVHKGGRTIRQDVIPAEVEHETVIDRGIRTITRTVKEFEPLQEVASNAQIRAMQQEIVDQRNREIRQHGDFSGTVVQTSRNLSHSLDQPDVVEVTTVHKDGRTLRQNVRTADAEGRIVFDQGVRVIEQSPSEIGSLHDASRIVCHSLEQPDIVEVTTVHKDGRISKKYVRSAEVVDEAVVDQGVRTIRLSSNVDPGVRTTRQQYEVSETDIQAPRITSHSLRQSEVVDEAVVDQGIRTIRLSSNVDPGVRTTRQHYEISETDIQAPRITSHSLRQSEVVDEAVVDQGIRTIRLSSNVDPGVRTTKHYEISETDIQAPRITSHSLQQSEVVDEAVVDQGIRTIRLSSNVDPGVRTTRQHYEISETDIQAPRITSHSLQQAEVVDEAVVDQGIRTIRLSSNVDPGVRTTRQHYEISETDIQAPRITSHSLRQSEVVDEAVVDQGIRTIRLSSNVDPGVRITREQYEISETGFQTPRQNIRVPEVDHGRIIRQSSSELEHSHYATAYYDSQTSRLSETGVHDQGIRILRQTSNESESAQSHKSDRQPIEYSIESEIGRAATTALESSDEVIDSVLHTTRRIGQQILPSVVSKTVETASAHDEVDRLSMQSVIPTSIVSEMVSKTMTISEGAHKLGDVIGSTINIDRLVREPSVSMSIDVGRQQPREMHSSTDQSHHSLDLSKKPSSIISGLSGTELFTDVARRVGDVIESTIETKIVKETSVNTSIEADKESQHGVQSDIEPTQYSSKPSSFISRVVSGIKSGLGIGDIHLDSEQFEAISDVAGTVSDVSTIGGKIFGGISAASEKVSSLESPHSGDVSINPSAVMSGVVSGSKIESISDAVSKSTNESKIISGISAISEKVSSLGRQHSEDVSINPSAVISGVVSGSKIESISDLVSKSTNESKIISGISAISEKVSSLGRQHSVDVSINPLAVISGVVSGSKIESISDPVSKSTNESKIISGISANSEKVSSLGRQHSIDVSINPSAVISGVVSGSKFESISGAVSKSTNESKIISGISAISEKVSSLGSQHSVDLSINPSTLISGVVSGSNIESISDAVSKSTNESTSKIMSGITAISEKVSSLGSQHSVDLSINPSTLISGVVSGSKIESISDAVSKSTNESKIISGTTINRVVDAVSQSPQEIQTTIQQIKHSVDMPFNPSAVLSGIVDVTSSGLGTREVQHPSKIETVTDEAHRVVRESTIDTQIDSNVSSPREIQELQRTLRVSKTIGDTARTVDDVVGSKITTKIIRGTSDNMAIDADIQSHQEIQSDIDHTGHSFESSINPSSLISRVVGETASDLSIDEIQRKSTILESITDRVRGVDNVREITVVETTTDGTPFQVHIQSQIMTDSAIDPVQSSLGASINPLALISEHVSSTISDLGKHMEHHTEQSVDTSLQASSGITERVSGTVSGIGYREIRRTEDDPGFATTVTRTVGNVIESTNESDVIKQTQHSVESYLASSFTVSGTTPGVRSLEIQHTAGDPDITGAVRRVGDDFESTIKTTKISGVSANLAIDADMESAIEQTRHSVNTATERTKRSAGVISEIVSGISAGSGTQEIHRIPSELETVADAVQTAVNTNVNAEIQSTVEQTQQSANVSFNPSAIISDVVSGTSTVSGTRVIKRISSKFETAADTARRVENLIESAIDTETVRGASINMATDPDMETQQGILSAIERTQGSADVSFNPSAMISELVSRTSAGSRSVADAARRVGDAIESAIETETVLGTSVNMDDNASSEILSSVEHTQRTVAVSLNPPAMISDVVSGTTGLGTRVIKQISSKFETVADAARRVEDVIESAIETKTALGASANVDVNASSEILSAVEQTQRSAAVSLNPSVMISDVVSGTTGLGTRVIKRISSKFETVADAARRVEDVIESAIETESVHGKSVNVDVNASSEIQSAIEQPEISTHVSFKLPSGSGTQEIQHTTSMFETVTDVTRKVGEVIESTKTIPGTSFNMSIDADVAASRDIQTKTARGLSVNKPTDADLPQSNQSTAEHLLRSSDVSFNLSHAISGGLGGITSGLGTYFETEIVRELSADRVLDAAMESSSETSIKQTQYSIDASFDPSVTSGIVSGASLNQENREFQQGPTIDATVVRRSSVNMAIDTDRNSEAQSAIERTQHSLELDMKSSAGLSVVNERTTSSQDIGDIRTSRILDSVTGAARRVNIAVDSDAIEIQSAIEQTSHSVGRSPRLSSSIAGVMSETTLVAEELSAKREDIMKYEIEKTASVDLGLSASIPQSGKVQVSLPHAQDTASLSSINQTGMISGISSNIKLGENMRSSHESSTLRTEVDVPSTQSGAAHEVVMGSSLDFETIQNIMRLSQIEAAKGKTLDIRIRTNVLPSGEVQSSVVAVSEVDPGTNEMETSGNISGVEALGENIQNIVAGIVNQTKSSIEGEISHSFSEVIADNTTQELARNTEIIGENSGKISFQSSSGLSDTGVSELQHASVDLSEAAAAAIKGSSNLLDTAQHFSSEMRSAIESEIHSVESADIRLSADTQTHGEIQTDIQRIRSTFESSTITSGAVGRIISVHEHQHTSTVACTVCGMRHEAIKTDSTRGKSLDIEIGSVMKSPGLVSGIKAGIKPSLETRGLSYSTSEQSQNVGAGLQLSMGTDFVGGGSESLRIGATDSSGKIKALVTEDTGQAVVAGVISGVASSQEIHTEIKKSKDIGHRTTTITLRSPAKLSVNVSKSEITEEVARGTSTFSGIRADTGLSEEFGVGGIAQSAIGSEISTDVGTLAEGDVKFAVDQPEISADLSLDPSLSLSAVKVGAKSGVGIHASTPKSLKVGGIVQTAIDVGKRVAVKVLSDVSQPQIKADLSLDPSASLPGVKVGAKSGVGIGGSASKSLRVGGIVQTAIDVGTSAAGKVQLDVDQPEIKADLSFDPSVSLPGVKVGAQSGIGIGGSASKSKKVGGLVQTAIDVGTGEAGNVQLDVDQPEIKADLSLDRSASLSGVKLGAKSGIGIGGSASKSKKVGILQTAIDVGTRAAGKVQLDVDQPEIKADLSLDPSASLPGVKVEAKSGVGIGGSVSKSKKVGGLVQAAIDVGTGAAGKVQLDVDQPEIKADLSLDPSVLLPGVKVGAKSGVGIGGSASKSLKVGGLVQTAIDVGTGAAGKVQLDVDQPEIKADLSLDPSVSLPGVKVGAKSGIGIGGSASKSLKVGGIVQTAIDAGTSAAGKVRLDVDQREMKADLSLDPSVSLPGVKIGAKSGVGIGGSTPKSLKVGGIVQTAIDVGTRAAGKVQLDIDQPEIKADLSVDPSVSLPGVKVGVKSGVGIGGSASKSLKVGGILQTAIDVGTRAAGKVQLGVDEREIKADLSVDPSVSLPGVKVGAKSGVGIGGSASKSLKVGGLVQTAIDVGTGAAGKIRLDVDQPEIKADLSLDPSVSLPGVKVGAKSGVGIGGSASKSVKLGGAAQSAIESEISADVGTHAAGKVRLDVDQPEIKADLSLDPSVSLPGVKVGAKSGFGIGGSTSKSLKVGGTALSATGSEISADVGTHAAGKVRLNVDQPKIKADLSVDPSASLSGVKVGAKSGVGIEASTPKSLKVGGLIQSAIDVGTHAAGNVKLDVDQPEIKADVSLDPSFSLPGVKVGAKSGKGILGSTSKSLKVGGTAQSAIGSEISADVGTSAAGSVRLAVDQPEIKAGLSVGPSVSLPGVKVGAKSGVPAGLSVKASASASGAKVEAKSALGANVPSSGGAQANVDISQGAGGSILSSKLGKLDKKGRKVKSLFK